MQREVLVLEKVKREGVEEELKKEVVLGLEEVKEEEEERGVD